MHESPLFTGRPQIGSRSYAEEKCYELLDSLSISFTRVDHDIAMTMEDLVAAEAVLGCSIAKNLFLTNRQHTAYFLLLMPGDKPFKTKDLSAQIDTARLSFASPEEMERLLGTTPGSASILGLMHDKDREVSLLIDRDILTAEAIGAHPLVNTSSLGLAVSDLLEKFLPAVGHTYRTVTL